MKETLLDMVYLTSIYDNGNGIENEKVDNYTTSIKQTKGTGRKKV